MGTEWSSDVTKPLKDIKATIAQDLGKRYAINKETLSMASGLDPGFKDSLKQRPVTPTPKWLRLQWLPCTQQSYDGVVDRKVNRLAPATHTPAPQPPMKRPRSFTRLHQRHCRTKICTWCCCSWDKELYRGTSPLLLWEHPLSQWKEHQHVSRVGKYFCVLLAQTFLHREL